MMHTCLTYAPQKLSAFVVERCLDFLDFQPVVAIAESLGKETKLRRWRAEVVAMLGKHQEMTHFELAAHPDLWLPCFSVNLHVGFQMLTISWTQETALENSVVHEMASAVPGFHGAYCGHWETIVEQSQALARSKPSERTLAATLSRYPSRQSNFHGTWLVSNWKMWFGSWMNQFVSLEKIAKCPFALQASRLESGTVYIQLAEGPDAADLPERQNEFWEWSGLASLEAKFYRGD